MFTVIDDFFHVEAKKMYCTIKDNPNISQDIKDGWLRSCIMFCDVRLLCNY